jgi:glycosyltransferase involved in cell wall biosynthesis
MPNNPRITVLMPVRNGAQYLEAACASVLTQADAAFEFLIVDDGSSDATPEILRRLSASDERVRVIRQPGKGIVAALNKGLHEAHAPLIARMDADDLSLPGRFARQVACLDAKPNVAVLGTGWRGIDAFGVEQQAIEPLTSTDAIRAELRHRNCLAHSSVMLRRELVLRHGLYRRALTGAEDYDLWLRLSEHYDVENLPEPLIALRQHPHQVTRLRLEQRILAEIGSNWLHRCRFQGPEPSFDAQAPMGRGTLAALGMTAEDISAGIVARALGAAIDARRCGDKAATRLAAKLVLAERPPRLRTRLHAKLLLIGAAQGRVP